MTVSRKLGAAILLGVTPWIIGPARAQPDVSHDMARNVSPQDAQAQLSAVLSLVSGGLLGLGGHTPRVTRDGNLYRVRVPLPELTAPPDAAIDATARPLADGVWDITSLALPSNGTVQVLRQGDSRPSTLSYSVGQQAIHGTIDPALAVPSPFAVSLGTVAVSTEGDGQRTTQTIQHYGMNGTLSGDADHRLTIETQGSLANWRIETHDRAGMASGNQIRSVAVSLGVEGLDRAQAARLQAAGRALAAGGTDRTANVPLNGTPKGGLGASRPAMLTPFQRDQMRAMLDASVGLLRRLNVQETLEGIHFDGAAANSGEIGRVSLGLNSETQGDRLNTQIDLTLNDLTLDAVPANLAAYVPNQVDVRMTAIGLRTAMLLRLLTDATAANMDPAVLRNEAMALLADPQTRIGIERLSFGSGLLQVTGSSRIRPLPGGDAAIDIHLAARGVDAMIAQAQDNPLVQPVLPLVFLAKGLAHTEGDALSWDISLIDGVATVNGMPLGSLGGRIPRP